MNKNLDSASLLGKLMSGVASYVKDFAKETLVAAVDQQVAKSRPKAKLRKPVQRKKK